MFFGCVEGKTLRSLLFLLSITFFFLFVVRWAFADGEQQQQPSRRQLAFVQCVWRHGDRAPGGRPYSGDPYDESYWPRGWSQLTNLGMEQMRELGQFLRKRYVEDLGFLGAKYDKKDVFVQSSESDRALTSAQALLHGMYPALDSGDQFDPQLGWQPIAVHSTGPNNELLKPTSFECPKYNKLKIEVKKQLGLELTKKYGELFEFLRIQVFNSTEPISLHKAAKLNDINREIIHNLSQPDWVHRLWPQYGNLSTLELVTELKRLERINEFKHPELAYLKGGFLLGDWLSRAEQVVKQKSPPEAQKAVLYSAHDGTLQALLYAMGLGDDRLVPYASLVCMELYRVEEEGRSSNNNSRHQMDILYRRSGELLPLKLANCTMENCPVDDAFKLLRKGAIFERQHLFKECGNSEDFCEVPTTREKGD